MNAIVDMDRGGFGLDDLFGQAINYAEQYKANLAVKKKEKKAKAKLAAQKQFVDNLLYKPSAQKAFFDSITGFILEMKSEILLSITQEGAIEFCKKIENAIAPIENFPKDHTIPEFDSIEEFHAYSSGRTFVEAIFSLYEGIKYVAENGQIDEDSPAYKLYIESEIEKILQDSPKREKIDSIEDFLTNL